MKTLFAILTLPLIAVLCFFASKCYLNNQFWAAYTLVFAWFAGIIFWIQMAGNILSQKLFSWYSLNS